MRAQEAHNAERVAAMFSRDPQVHVPFIHRQYTTPRVIVMEYIDGVKVSASAPQRRTCPGPLDLHLPCAAQLTDKPGMARLGIEPRAVAPVLSRVFADMAHVHGCVVSNARASCGSRQPCAAGFCTLIPTRATCWSGSGLTAAGRSWWCWTTACTAA